MTQQDFTREFNSQRRTLQQMLEDSIKGVFNVKPLVQTVKIMSDNKFHISVDQEPVTYVEKSNYNIRQMQPANLEINGNYCTVDVETKGPVDISFIVVRRIESPPHFGISYDFHRYTINQQMDIKFQLYGEDQPNGTIQFTIRDRPLHEIGTIIQQFHVDRQSFIGKHGQGGFTPGMNFNSTDPPDYLR